MGGRIVSRCELLFVGLVTLVLISNSAFAWEMNWSRESGDATEARSLFREAFSRLSLEGAAATAPGGFENTKDEHMMPLLMVDQGDSSLAEQYIETLVLNAETFNVVGENGKLRARMTFKSDRLRFPFGERESRDLGQVYAIDFDREVSLDVYYAQGALYASNLQGLNVQVKLFIIPDSLKLKQFLFSFDNQMASLYASAVYDLVHLVARASVRLRRFEGIDWFLPVLESLPTVMDSVSFWPARERASSVRPNLQ